MQWFCNHPVIFDVVLKLVIAPYELSNMMNIPWLFYVPDATVVSFLWFHPLIGDCVIVKSDLLDTKFHFI